MAEAEVTLQTLPFARARRQMESPLEMRKGQITGMTLTIPLLSGANSYLIVKMPAEEVNSVLGQAQALPQDKRAAFIHEWVMSNKQAVLERYVSGGKEKRFTYGIVPVRGSALGTVARRTSPVPVPIFRPPAPKEEQRAVEPPPAPIAGNVRAQRKARQDLSMMMMREDAPIPERAIFGTAKTDSGPERKVQRSSVVQIDISEGSTKTAAYASNSIIPTVRGGPLRISVNVTYRPFSTMDQASKAGDKFSGQLKVAIAKEATNQGLMVERSVLEQFAIRTRADFIREALKGRR